MAAPTKKDVILWLKHSKKNWGVAVRYSLKTGIDPLRDVIEEVLYRIRVLTRRGFAPRARSASVRGAFDDNKILIFAGCHFVMNLAVSNKVMSAHGRDQDRHRNARYGAIR